MMFSIFCGIVETVYTYFLIPHLNFHQNQCAEVSKLIPTFPGSSSCYANKSYQAFLFDWFAQNKIKKSFIIFFSLLWEKLFWLNVILNKSEWLCFWDLIWINKNEFFVSQSLIQFENGRNGSDVFCTLW